MKRRYKIEITENDKGEYELLIGGYSDDDSENFNIPYKYPFEKIEKALVEASVSITRINNAAHGKACR